MPYVTTFLNRNFITVQIKFWGITSKFNSKLCSISMRWTDSLSSRLTQMHSGYCMYQPGYSVRTFCIRLVTGTVGILVILRRVVSSLRALIGLSLWWICDHNVIKLWGWYSSLHFELFTAQAPDDERSIEHSAEMSRDFVTILLLLNTGRQK